MSFNILRLNDETFSALLELMNFSKERTSITFPNEKIIFVKEENKSNLMTREMARLKVFAVCKNLEGRECSQLVEALEALGLIKFEEEEKFNAYHEAKKYCKDIYQYDGKNPLNTIAEMQKIIEGLVDMINERYKDD